LINNFSKKLCGKYRPGHFIAVADVINRFIKIINPKNIYFGKKDMQQFIILKDFIKRNYKNINVVGCKTIREKNGIALSSRNELLSKRQKNIGSLIYHMILNKKNELITRKYKITKIKKEILKAGVKKIDYIETININKLIKPYKKKNNFRIFIAYYLGETRIIDNI